MLLRSDFSAFAAIATLLGGCGQASLDARTRAARDSIVGGSPDSKHPGVVLVHSDPTFGPCSGTLVAPNLVLTARHCVSLETGEIAFCGNASDPMTGFDLPVYGADRTPSELSVSIVPNGPAVAHGVEIFHDASNTTCRHDLALFQIEPAIMEIPPAPVRRSPPVVGETLTVAGWGYIDDAQTQSTDVLRAKDVDVLAVGPLKYAFHPFGDAASPLQDQAVVESEFLVTIGTSALGDSGAPGFDAAGKIVGTVARGYPTPSYGPSTLSAVSAHLSVIDDAFEAAGYDPGAGAGGATAGASGSGGNTGAAGPTGGGGDATGGGTSPSDAEPPSGSDEGGCAVRTAPRSDAMGGALAFAALGLAAALRRARAGRPMSYSQIGAPVLAAALVVASAGCSGDVTCDNCNSPGSEGETCTFSVGTLEGTVYRYGLPGEAGSSIAPNAFVSLRASGTPEVTPLVAKADADGRYSVEIDAGEWLVDGEHENCSTLDEPTHVRVEACRIRELDLPLPYCTKGTSDGDPP